MSAKELIQATFMILGTAMIITGISMWSVPMALVVGGGICFAMVVAAS